jgi:hypothetical protein
MQAFIHFLVSLRKGIFVPLLSAIKRLLLFFVLVFIGLFFPFYMQTEIYDFFETEPFSGNTFYNPYQNWQNQGSQKANFHAHSKAWLGLTNGENTPKEIEKVYKAKGYGIACLSNYQSISEQTASKGNIVPVYEHGFNLKKTHQLAIGAESVSYLEFPFFQNLSQKQMVINRIKEHSRFVALAHPTLRNGYSANDMAYLSNYDFIEVLSPYANSLALWDTALKHGKKEW